MVAGGPAQPVHQDPGDRRGPARDHRGPGRGHQRQRHADLLPGTVRPGHRRVHGRAGAGPGRRAGTSPRSPRWRPSSSAGWTPRSTAGSTRSAPPRRPRCAARRRSPTPGSPTSCTRSGSPPPAGRRCARPGPRCSARCGPRPAPRTPPSRTPCTWSNWSRPDTVNTMPEATLRATADHAKLRGDTIQRHLRRSPGRSSPTWRRSASATTTWSRVLEDEGVAEVRRLLERVPGHDRVEHGRGGQAMTAGPPGNSRRSAVMTDSATAAQDATQRPSPSSAGSRTLPRPSARPSRRRWPTRPG